MAGSYKGIGTEETKIRPGPHFKNTIDNQSKTIANILSE
jgi:hypothetical protein